MAAKNRFPKKIGEVKANITFEEMAGSNNSASVFKDEVDFEIEDDQLEDDELEDVDFDEDKIEYRTPEESFTPPSIDINNFVSKDELDDYLNKRWEEKLEALKAEIPQSPRVEAPQAVPRKVESEDDLPEFNNWEARDRIYVICTGYSSLSQGIKDRHKKNSPLMYKGRSLRFSTSQGSFFMDQQKGDVLINFITIENGKLFIPKENSHLQKFLAIHPDNGVVFKEFDPRQESKAEYDVQKITLDAHILSREVDSGTLIAVAMLMLKDYTEDMDLITIKRYLYNEIQANPKLFIKLASDPTLKLKSIGKIAVFRNLLRYADYRFYDENDVVLCEANRNENEYEALAAYFASDAGRNLFEYLKRKIED